MKNISEDNHHTIAKTAGFLYLIIIVCGLSSEVMIRGSLIIPDDAIATIGNIVASEALFKTGFVADSIMLLSDVIIAVLFYTLFKSANKNFALLASAFRLIQTAILSISLLSYYSVQLVIQRSDILLENSQLQSQVMLLLDMHSYGYDLGLIFFSLSNFVLGYIFIKWNSLPTFLGAGLIISATVYLTGSYIRFLSPEYISYIQPVYIVPVLAELSLCLWLMIRGVNVSDRNSELQTNCQ